MGRVWLKLPNQRLLEISTSEAITRNFLLTEIERIFKKRLQLRFGGFMCGYPLVEVGGVMDLEISSFGLAGGKGGFGNTIRSERGWAKKTTNFDSSRTLDGDRLRATLAVDQLREWSETQQRDDEVVRRLGGREPDRPSDVRNTTNEQRRAVAEAGRSKKRLIEEAMEMVPEKPDNDNKSVKKAKNSLLDLGLSSDSE